MFTAEDIKTRTRQQPFVPLRIVTSGGEAYEIFHPDLIWVGAREVHIGTAHPAKPTFYNMTARVAIMHITALEDLPAQAPSANKNGPVS